MGKWQELLEQELRTPFPREDRMEMAKKHNRKALGLTKDGGGQRREWRTEPGRVSAYASWRPSWIDGIAEAILGRRRPDPLGGVWGGYESIDDVVRRQDETR